MHNINITDENKENISLNIINRNGIKYQSITHDEFSKKNNRIIITKNKIIGNLIKESIFHSKDNKLALKIHTLKNINQIFSKKKEYISTLSMEKVNFCISNKNNSKNNAKYTIKFPKKAKNNAKNKMLSSIKE